MLDILVYLYESFRMAELAPERDALEKRLFAAGFQEADINAALDWFAHLSDSTAHERLSHAQVLAIALPIMLSNATVPLIGFADQVFISKADLVAPEEVDALIHRLKHMNPRAPMRPVHFGEVAIKDVFDLRGFNLNAKLDIDPDFLKADEEHDHAHHDHDHGEHCDHPSHQHGDGAHGHHHHHDDDVKSFVYRATRPFNPAKLEDFLGAIVQVYGPRMLRYKGVLDMEGTDRKVIFQGVHQLMGSDLGPAWAEGEARTSKMVFIGLDLPKDILVQGLDQSLV